MTNINDFDESKKPTEQVEIKMPEQVTAPAQGELEITATAAQTEDLPPQKYTYDLEVYLGNQVIRLLQGTIIVNAETTRI